jgi:hypothetical protein
MHRNPHPVDNSVGSGFLPLPSDLLYLLLWCRRQVVDWYTMKKAQNVVVYLRADDVRMLERRVLHTDPPGWVRGLVKRALEVERKKEESSE